MRDLKKQAKLEREFIQAEARWVAKLDDARLRDQYLVARANLEAWYEAYRGEVEICPRCEGMGKVDAPRFGGWCFTCKGKGETGFVPPRLPVAPDQRIDRKNQTDRLRARRLEEIKENYPTLFEVFQVLSRAQEASELFVASLERLGNPHQGLHRIIQDITKELAGASGYEDATERGLEENLRRLSDYYLKVPKKSLKNKGNGS